MSLLLLLIEIFMQALYLNCPELNDLNLNSCMNLNPGLHFHVPHLGCDLFWS